jgi:hypothetical protein
MTHSFHPTLKTSGRIFLVAAPVGPGHSAVTVTCVSASSCVR